jgi:hypothetical protein
VKVRTKPGPKTRGRPGRGAFDPETADRLVSRLRNTLFPEQQNVFDDESGFISFLVARGGGKTSAWLMRALRRCIKTKRARVLFIATTVNQARILIWDDLKDVVDKLGLGEDTGESSFNESRHTFTLTRTGATIRLVGADDNHEIDKLRGKSFHEVGIDEGASHAHKLLRDLVERVLAPRLGDTDGVICLFGTPGHLLAGLFYDVTRPGSPHHRPYVDRHSPDAKPAMWSSHAWTMEDGAKHVPAIAKLWARALKDKRDAGWGDDHPVWVRERLGRWAADDTENIYRYRPHLEDGRPWNEWDPERVGPLRIAKLPGDRKDWIVGFGADMGAADPFALHAFAASPSDPTRSLYHIFEFEAAPDSKMYAKRIAELLFGPDTGPGWPNHKSPSGLIGAVGWPAAARADMAHLGEAILEELAKVYGFRFEPSPRGFGDKLAAIELFNGDLVDGRTKILKGSKLAIQLSSLQWITDEFGKVKENKSQPNHSADAAITARGTIANVFEGYSPVAAIAPTAAGGMPRQRSDEDVDVPSSFGDADAFGGEFSDAWGNG